MPNPITFTLGWELEACRAARDVPEGVIQETDGSVSGDGREYKIAPSLVTDPRASLKALETLCTDPRLHVNRTCGFHVHVGVNGRVSTKVLKQWASAFVLLARRVESHAFMAVPPSRRANNYCRSWTSDGGSVIVRRYSGHKYGNTSRYQWVNVVEIFRPGGIKTVEIRLLGSTKRYPYLLAWAGVCHKMAHAAWRLMSDPSALEEEASALQSDFRMIASEILTVRSAPSAAHVALTLATRGQLITDSYAREIEPSILHMARVRADAQETAETRFTEEQAWIEMGRLAIVADAHTAANIEQAERIYGPTAQRRAVRADEPATLAEHMRVAREMQRADLELEGRRARTRTRRRAAPVAQVIPLPSLEAMPAGYNPDAFNVIPTNQGGTR